MKTKEKTKKLSSQGMTTREKMLARKKQLESKGSGNGFVFCKDGTTRIRIKSPGDDQEIGLELITFFLGGDQGSIYSPATFDEPCPFMEKYLELKNSKDDEDKELAKKFIPKRRYAVGALVYNDEKGKSFDYDGKDKVVVIPRGVYQDIVELYLDEDDYGDMTDPKDGYDIKITRTGSGKMDTTYSARACQKSRLDKQYQGTVDLEGMVRAQIKSYDELEEILAKFLNEAPEDDEDEDFDEKPEKKKKSLDKDKKFKKKKFKGDI